MSDDDAPAVSPLERLLAETPIDVFRKLLLKLARKKLGEPTAEQEAFVLGIEDYDWLFVTAALRLGDAGSWDELLSRPSPITRLCIALRT